ncbi:NACHT domain-containing protein [Streptomyces sp. SID5474]|nr:NACHT domain-containing protein [Streptomyces sp. SID5474]
MVWLVVWGSHDAERGDVDWASASIALPGLGVAVWSAWMTRTALRSQDTDVVVVAARLAVLVTRAESPERARLLGDDHTPIDLRFVLRPAPAHNAEGADPDGRLGTVVDYYRRLRPGRLVITGAPGSGKTVLALELLLAILESRAPGDPVPVRMSLASWTTPLATGNGADAGRAFEEWVRDHLERVYRLSPTAARALVEAGMVLPVLDGLDEMDAAGTTTGGPHPRGGPRARRALETLNAYTRGRTRAEIVLTCRSGPYEALDTWAKSAARVEIIGVTPAQARDFVLARVDDPHRWREVIHALDTDPSGALARNLSTPWRLTTAVMVHEQRHLETGAYPHAPRSLLSPALANDTALREHLNRLYVRAATEHPTPRGLLGHTPEQAHAWLHVLARHLDTNTTTAPMVGGRGLSGTDLVPHELWPLAGRRPHVVHLLQVMITAGILGYAATAYASSSVVGSSRPVAIGVGAACGTVLLTVYRPRYWPRPTRLDPGQLCTPQGRRKALTKLALSLTVGIAFVIAFAITLGIANDGSTDVLTNALKGVLTNAFPSVAGIMLGLPFGLSAGLSNDGGTEVKDPRNLVRADLAFGITLGIVFGSVLGLGTMLGITKGIAPPFAFTLMVGFAFGLLKASAGMRYLAFLLCVRVGPRTLPWRLGRFLHWATGAGLLRTAGIAYQFRHRELQDWLAHNPTP